eukprot:Sspe_Gene.93431::Locus_66071_Transcript_1_1_Confidence_1.000_Length_456::g.93431::m.93431
MNGILAAYNSDASSDEEGVELSMLVVQSQASLVRSASSPEAAPPAPKEVKESVTERMMRELELEKWDLPQLGKTVPTTVPLSSKQTDLILALQRENREPTAYVRDRHEFINPERVAQVLQELAHSAGRNLKEYQSH